MITLHSLVPVKNKQAKKRVGRGYGSGRGGHTTGRGSKGHKARGKVKLGFSGTKTKKSWLKRLPLWRGKGKLKARRGVLTISLDQLDNNYQDGDKVSKESLVAKKLVKSEKARVKVLANGSLKKKLIISLPCSQLAEKKIIKAGGQLVK